MYLGKDITQTINSDVQRFHIDIMDGHLVPNLSYGPQLIQDLKSEFPQVFTEIHLISNNLAKMTSFFTKTECNLFEFHLESSGKENIPK